eukprot:SAG11_NODE_753_length_7341_cov_4.014637_5_plen_227_part_00
MVAESSTEFQFAVNKLLSPKPWRNLKDETKNVLTVAFGVQETDWARLRGRFFRRESKRMVAARLAFTSLGAEEGFDAAVGQVTKEQFCRLVRKLNWDLSRLPIFKDEDRVPETRSRSPSTSSETEQCKICGKQLRAESASCSSCLRAELLYRRIVEYWDQTPVDELQQDAGYLGKVTLGTRSTLLLTALERRQKGERVSSLGFNEFLSWMDTPKGWAIATRLKIEE